MGSVVKKVVGIAAPVIGIAVGGPVGGAIGGAIGGAVSGGGLKGALLGAATGFIGGKLSGGGGFGSLFSSAGGSGTAAGGSGVDLIGRSTSSIGGSFGNSLATSATTAGNKLGFAFGQNTSNLATAALGKSFSVAGMDISGSKLGSTGFSDAISKSLVTNLANDPGYTAPLSLGETALGKTDVGFLSGLDKVGLKEIAAGAIDLYESSNQQAYLDAYEKEIKRNAGYAADPGYIASIDARLNKLTTDPDSIIETEAYKQQQNNLRTQTERILIAQGHNPAESGFGLSAVNKVLDDHRQSFITNERDYLLRLKGSNNQQVSQLNQAATNKLNSQNSLSGLRSAAGVSLGSGLLRQVYS